MVLSKKKVCVHTHGNHRYFMNICEKKNYQTQTSGNSNTGWSGAPCRMLRKHRNRLGINYSYINQTPSAGTRQGWWGRGGSHFHSSLNFTQTFINQDDQIKARAQNGVALTKLLPVLRCCLLIIHCRCCFLGVFVGFFVSNTLLDFFFA